MLILCMSAPLARAEQSPSALEKLSSIISIKSHSGKITIVGRDRRECLDLGKWSDSILVKAEAVLRSKMIFKSRRFYISIRNNRPKPGVSSGLERSSLGIIQRLIIINYDKVKIQDVQDAYCHAILSGTALELKLASGVPSDVSLPVLPRWLWVGTSMNLDRTLRSQHSDLVIEKWEDGCIPSLVSVLKERDKDTLYYQNDPELDNALNGMVVSWLVSMRGNGDIIGDILKACSEGKNISINWILSYFADFKNISDIEDSWDRWLLAQKRRIYVPGRLSSRAVNQLKSELLLYPGVFGIPLTDDIKGAMTLRGLIERQSEKWVPGLVDNKITRLRLLGVGRGRDFEKTVDLYCRFLQALKEGASRDKLAAMLDEAELMLAAVNSQTTLDNEKKKE